LASRASSILWRALLVAGGLGLLALAWVLSQLPRAGEPRIEVRDGLVGVHDGQSYAWVIRTRTGAVLVDAGGDTGGAVLLAELAREGLKRDDVHAVLLTHGHKDHWGAAHIFPRARVHAGAAELPYLRGERRYGSLLGGAFNRLVPAPLLPLRLQGLAGGEVLELDGASVRVLAVPGHTPGSLAFLWHDVLFSGDTLLGGGGRVAPPPSFVTESPAENRRSLAGLRTVPFTTLADGHTGVTERASGKLEAALGQEKR